eukprot:Skav212269  [mRNA]  locus=scaffold732:126938:127621:- [translate_table: standard]
MTYIQAAAGWNHTVLIRSDGIAVTCGSNSDGQCDIPPLDAGVTYIQASAAINHSVLLRSDGSAVACGYKGDGSCDIPPVADGVTYVQVSAGHFHTVLLRSDGSAIARGYNGDGQCQIPSLPLSWKEWLCFGSPSLRYVADVSLMARGPERILQLDFLQEGDAMILRCVGMDGEEVARLRTRGSDLAVDALRHFKHRVVLPDCQLLDKVCAAEPSITVAAVRLEHDKP